MEERNDMTRRMLTLFMTLLLLFAASDSLWAYGETTSYVLNEATEKDWSTIGNSGTYTLSGPARTLQFQAKRTAILGFSNTDNFYAQYSEDGSSWTKVLTFSLSSKDV